MTSPRFPYVIRLAQAEDEAFLWRMLYYAAHMDEEPGASAESAKSNPDLAYYVEAWKQRGGDLGFIALSPEAEAVGAAWIRLMPPSSPLYKHVPQDTPELAIGVEPAHRGVGAGALLLHRVLDHARGVHRTIALSVRANNPARGLYERLGFVTVARIRNRVGGVSFVMNITLDPPASG
jgi:ribosomal protein S18 acetylase RimI-like enzyme